MPAFRRVEPRLRTLAALLALAATLIAAGVPVLHAAAHLGHHGEAHGELASAVDHGDHDHDAIHPAALHDDAAPTGRSSIGFALPGVADLPILHVTLHERRDIPIPVPRLSSRAPPPGDPARAPPLA